MDSPELTKFDHALIRTAFILAGLSLVVSVIVLVGS